MIKLKTVGRRTVGLLGVGCVGLISLATLGLMKCEEHQFNYVEAIAQAQNGLNSLEVRKLCYDYALREQARAQDFSLNPFHRISSEKKPYTLETVTIASE